MRNVPHLWLSGGLFDLISRHDCSEVNLMVPHLVPLCRKNKCRKCFHVSKSVRKSIDRPKQPDKTSIVQKSGQLEETAGIHKELQGKLMKIVVETLSISACEN